MDEKNIRIVITAKKDDSILMAAENLLDLYYNDVPINIEIGPQKESKSLSANNYAWHLICQIAKVITSTKEEVYQQLIKDYGVCAVLSVKASNYEAFVNEWTQNGLGYFAEIIDGDDENINAFFYKGISAYSPAEMGKFIDGIVYECEQLGIETRTKEELEKLKTSWRQNL